MNKRRLFYFHSYGYTLSELLIVLAILSILLLIIAPISVNMFEETHEKNFIRMFEMDLLYIQSLAVTSRKRARIVVYDHEYWILHGEEQARIRKRTLPDHIKIHMNRRANISFNHNGRIRNPNLGKIEIHTKKSVYHVVFPLGKGRASIVRQ